MAKRKEPKITGQFTKSELKQVPIATLIPYDKNPRKNADAVDKVAASLKEFGLVKNSVLCDENMVLITGHTTIKAMQKLGWDKVPEVTQVSGLTENQKKAYRIADNKLGEIAEWDLGLLTAQLNELKIDGMDISITGFDDKEFDGLLRELHKDDEPLDTEPQISRAEELRKEWGTEVGQLWQCGSHRVICGDCTDPAVVQRVMGGEKVNLLFTSPPYWVGKEYESQKSEKEIDEFIKSCVFAWTDFISVDMGRICINTGSAAIHRIEKNRKVECLPLVDKWQSYLKQRGWLARHWRIWAKSGDFPASISPKTDVVDQHWENILTFDNDEFSILGTWWAPAGEQRGQERIGTPWAQQGVWSDITGQKSGGVGHIAAFPLELPLRNIRLYSQIKESVYDPFLGSGTTMIACENLGRKCRGCEIDPGYVAVILQRYKDTFPGKEIKLIE